MKRKIEMIINQYLSLFPNELNRLSLLNEFLKKENDEMIFDWNNANGHITVGSFVYSKSDDAFLVLYHKDLKMYLYPGGHVNNNDRNIIEAAKRELKEETGLTNLELFTINNEVLPFDIHTHIIPFNERVNMSEHYHFDFRFLFLIDEICNVHVDEDELEHYKWVSAKELSEYSNFGNIVEKIKILLK